MVDNMEVSMRILELRTGRARFAGSRKTCNRAIFPWLAALSCIATSVACEAAPTITSVAGTLADGQTIAVNGSGFGRGPTVLLFDDFESGNGAAGNVIPLSSPEVGQWSSYTNEGGRPRYSPHARSGTHGWRITDPAFSPDNGNAQASFMKVLPSSVTEFFVSYAFYVPPGTTFPGASEPGTLPAISSWKGLWLYDGPEGFKGNGKSDICIPTWAHPFYLAGNSGNVVDSGDLGRGINSPKWFSFTDWNRLTVWMKADPSAAVTRPGTIFVQATNLDRGHFEHTWTDRSPFQGPTAYDNKMSSGKWDRFTVPGWWGNGDNTHNQMTYDDVYVAAGPNAAARIEIGDAPTYTASRNLAISTPKTWSDGSIAFVVRAGPFTDFSKAYLYVIDANNNVSVGFPLGQANPAPASPSNVSVK
jgi:hypothetical protein